MLSIIIPAYNEEKRIGETLEEYLRFFSEKKENKEIGDFELLVVLNGCKDNTLRVVEKYTKKFSMIRYLNFEQAGKGFAIIEGFKDALNKGKKLIGFVDADMATKPESFYDLIQNIENYDGIIASRGLKESEVKTSFMRKLTNRGFNFVVRIFLFLPFKDTQCGAKLFKREALNEVIDEIGMTEWAFDVDLLYKLRKKGFKVKEIPTIWEDKTDSKLNLTIVPFKMFSSVVRLRLLNSPFRFIVRAYDKLPEKIKVHNL